MNDILHIVFRVDSSIVIGSGHVMRCLSLARHLRARGATVHFICRDLPGNCGNSLLQSGFKVHWLPESEVKAELDLGASSRATWLGVDWEVDAKQTTEMLESMPPADWLVVDHYALDHKWELVMHTKAGRIMVIDDLADRTHSCDLLLDQNLRRNGKLDYEKLVSKDCECLIGPSYALLRKEFCFERTHLRKRDGSISRLLVFMGVGDPTGETLKVLSALHRCNSPDITVDVVVGSSNPRLEEIRAEVSRLNGATLRIDVPDMADRMASADLAVGAAGTATWERCCVGLPAVVMICAENQREIAVTADEKGLLRNLGEASLVTQDDIARALDQCLVRPDLVRDMSQRGLEATDGLGVHRVCCALGLRSLRITIVSDEDSWINDHLGKMVETLSNQGHRVRWTHSVDEIQEGDICFLLSLSKVVVKDLLQRNLHNIVVHESELPSGRGWSPLTWQIIEGKNEIPVTLFEASEAVDAGPVYLRDVMSFEGTELVGGLRRQQAAKTIDLCLKFMADYPEITARGQSQDGSASYYPRRRPADSRLDPDRTLREQFAVLRVADNERYPAYFEIDGVRFVLRVSGSEDE